MTGSDAIRERNPLRRGRVGRYTQAFQFSLALTLALAIVSVGQALAQQDWPTRPVKLVVPFGAGGSADRLGRIAADHLSKAFKQQFFVENRVGAGGSVATRD